MEIPNSKFQIPRARGFTLIELLIVFSTIGILAGLGIAMLVTYSRQQSVNQAALELKGNLRLAQSKALSQEVPLDCTNLTAYELSFQSDSVYTVYPICDGFPGRNIAKVTLPPSVTKTSGPSALRFRILTGATDTTGTIEISGFGIKKSFNVSSTGRIQ